MYGRVAWSRRPRSSEILGARLLALEILADFFSTDVLTFTCAGGRDVYGCTLTTTPCWSEVIVAGL